MKRMGLPAIVCTVALAAACNSATRTDNQVNNGTDGRDSSAVGTTGETDRAVRDSDQDFVAKMLSDGDAEVELGKMAAAKASNAEVKRFGQMMVDDHTKAGAELKQIASADNIQATPKIDDKHQDLMNKLSKLSGAEFDREYMDAMVDGHQDVVDALQSRVDSTASLKDRITNSPAKDTQVVPEQSNNAPKADVNSWAANTLPVVRHHLDQAKQIKDKLDNNRRDTTTRNETSPAPRK
jgi:putative membrane protein